MQFQLRTLLSFIVLTALALFAYSEFATTGVAIVALLAGATWRNQNRNHAPTKRSANQLLVILPATLWLTLIGLGWGFHLFGPILFVSSTSEGNHLVEAFHGTSVHAYCCENFIDSETVYSMKVQAESIDDAIARFDANLGKVDSMPAPFYRQFPIWMRPVKSEDSVAYSTPHFPISTRGNDGMHWMLLYQPRTRRLFVWCKNNF